MQNWEVLVVVLLAPSVWALAMLQGKENNYALIGAGGVAAISAMIYIVMVAARTRQEALKAESNERALLALTKPELAKWACIENLLHATTAADSPETLANRLEGLRRSVIEGIEPKQAGQLLATFLKSYEDKAQELATQRTDAVREAKARFHRLGEDIRERLNGIAEALKNPPDQLGSSIDGLIEALNRCTEAVEPIKASSDHPGVRAGSEQKGSTEREVSKGCAEPDERMKSGGASG
jgi:hypothetical protein